MKDNRSTIRVADGGVHYDFPGYHVETEDDGRKVYHRVEKNYPIKAIKYKGAKGQILYPSGKKRECNVVEIIDWDEKWEVQLHCIDDGGEFLLVANGAITDMLELPREKSVVDVGGTNIQVERDGDGLWRISDLGSLKNMSANRVSAGRGISKSYNKQSDLLSLGFSEKPRSLGPIIDS